MLRWGCFLVVLGGPLEEAVVVLGALVRFVRVLLVAHARADPHIPICPTSFPPDSLPTLFPTSHPQARPSNRAIPTPSQPSLLVASAAGSYVRLIAWANAWFSSVFKGGAVVRMNLPNGVGSAC